MEKLNQNMFETKKVVLTGGTEGIGRAIADDLLDEGHEIAICARTESKIKEIKKLHPDIHAKQVDLADRHNAQEFIDESISELGGIDVLILNAGVTGLKEDKEYAFKVNEVANIALSRTAIESLRENHGRIVFITSDTAHTDLGGGIETYREGKLRMEQWLKDFSGKPENQDVTIIMISPGSVNTRMHQEVLVFGVGDIKHRTELKIMEHQLRDPKVVGKIISKIALSGKNFNPQTQEYSIPIKSGEVIRISDQNIQFESVYDKK